MICIVISEANIKDSPHFVDWQNKHNIIFECIQMHICMYNFNSMMIMLYNRNLQILFLFSHFLFVYNTSCLRSIYVTLEKSANIFLSEVNIL